MTVRRPLVVIAGGLQELPPGDSLAGATGVGTTGSAIIDLARGANTASVTVTDASVTPSTQIQAWFGGSTADNDEQAHLLASRHVGLTVVPAAGSFVIQAYNPDEMTGQFQVQ